MILGLVLWMIKGVFSMSILDMASTYELYNKSDDKIIYLEGLAYYKIISKSKLSIKEGLIMVCLPIEIFRNEAVKSFVDENGRIFKIGDSAHFSFKETIPIWYYNTLTVSLEGVHETDEIGEYLTPYLG